MNDRYLFRGKRVDNGKRVEGYLYITHNGEYEIGSYKAETNIERMTSVVIPKTIRQCTGLKDKNGKLIFEGDVLCEGKKRGVVKYENCYYVFWWKIFDKYRPDFFKKCTLTDYTNFSNLEIIGNVTDNPELLEVKE